MAQGERSHRLQSELKGPQVTRVLRPVRIPTLSGLAGGRRIAAAL